MMVHGAPVPCVYPNLAHEIVKSGVTLEELAKNGGMTVEELKEKLAGRVPWGPWEQMSIVALLKLGEMDQDQLWHKRP